MESSMWKFHVKTNEKPNNRHSVSGLLEMARSSVLKDNEVRHTTSNVLVLRYN